MKKLITYILITVCTASHTFSADIQQLLQDTQKMTQQGTRTNMVWWIPSAFWEESLRQNPQLTEEQKREFVAALDDYTAFVIVYMNIGVLGGMTFKTRDEILENISLEINQKEIDPLSTDELSADASAFYTMMKPMMAQMLGQFGQGMEFIVYPNKRKGKMIIDPLSEGGFTYTSFGEKHEWRLPLGSLLPEKHDPKTGENFPGNYKFNPYTGSELIVK